MQTNLVMVGVRGFEPPAPASRRQCSTKLSYTPILSYGTLPATVSAAALATTVAGIRQTASREGALF